MKPDRIKEGITYDSSPPPKLLHPHLHLHPHPHPNPNPTTTHAFVYSPHVAERRGWLSDIDPLGVEAGGVGALKGAEVVGQLAARAQTLQGVGVGRVCERETER